ncbi:MAG: hypothetical protein OEQ74_00675 [Gammaproteobacteria bacterium]|nr:hypothetical protein [Gammaproteobacteria bacterium]
MGNDKRAGRWVLACTSLACIFATQHAGAGQPVELSIEPPPSVAPNGWLFTEGWPLVFSMKVETAVAFLADDISSGQGDLDARQALVISDPDNCLDVRSFDRDNFPFEQDCAAGEDETYFAFRFDPYDGPGLRNFRCGNPPPPVMVDTPFDSGNIEGLNKAYIASASGNLRAVGPPSGGERDEITYPFASDDPAVDCYGFGADRNGVEGLVVWTRIGASKVLDQHLSGTGPGGEVRRLRNAAGFVTSVGSVLVDNQDNSYVIANLMVPRALFEPLVAVDTSINAAGPYTACDYLRKIDEGPIECLNYDGDVGVNVARARAIVADLRPSKVTLKAVLVAGPAPDFLTDANFDGKFTEADLVAEGHTLLSNVATYRFKTLRPYNIETGGDRCPPNNMLVAKDLDGADIAFDFYSCSTGSARSGRRVPR